MFNRKKSVIIILNIIVISLLTCSSEPQKYKWKGIKEIKEGVIYMRNPEEGLWQNRKRFEMDRILQIGVDEGDENYLLSNPSSIITDNYDNIYVLDPPDNCIKVYNKNGNYLRRIGKMGQGPGEFIEPMQIAINKNNQLYVLSKSKVSCFTLNGEFINSFNLRGIREWDIAFLPDNENIFISRIFMPGTPVKEYDHIFFEFSPDGILVNKYGELVPKSNKLQFETYSMAFITASRNGLFLTSFIYPYIIRVYDNNLTHKITITRECAIFSESKVFNFEYFKILVTRGNIIRKSFILSDGKILVIIGDTGEDFYEKFKGRSREGYSSIIYDLYDQEGHFLQSFKWKNKGEEMIVYIDQNDYAYTLKGDNEIPRVTKYKLSIK